MTRLHLDRPRLVETNFGQSVHAPLHIVIAIRCNCRVQRYAICLSLFLPCLQGSLTLMGGAFDLATHPAVQRFMEEPQISYKPLLFIVNTDTEKKMIT